MLKPVRWTWNYLKKRKLMRVVNRIRAVFGGAPISDLPKGRRDAAGSCPVARALKMPGTAGISVAVDSLTFRSQAAAQKFVDELPEFVNMMERWNYVLGNLVKSAPPFRLSDNLWEVPLAGRAAEYINDFVDHFDRGDIPQYDARRKAA